MQAAWLRRFTANSESNLRAFALRLKEAMPDLVTIHESKGFFARSAKTTGLVVELGDNRYGLKIVDGRLKATIAIVVRGITLNTKNCTTRRVVRPSHRRDSKGDRAGPHAQPFAGRIHEHVK